jgi:hypothetical protein
MINEIEKVIIGKREVIEQTKQDDPQ